jgi:phytanoyl-CoA hydroxylase
MESLSKQESNDSILKDYEISDALQKLNSVGVVVIPGAIDVELCSQVVRDYQDYCLENRVYVDENRDVLGREKRLVNFHLHSDAALKIGTNDRTMQIVDAFFNSKTSVYTSLTFKYGTQQPVHRDTPHFATWPQNLFVGVWTALEDIDPTSGPIFYHPGAHRFTIDHHKFLEKAKEITPSASLADQLVLALDLYNGEVIRNAPTISDPVVLNLRKGDTVIWHPEMPHGGSGASDPLKTRWSMVFHCAPQETQVHQYEAFFQSTSAPPPKYGFIDKYERKIAASGAVSFM